MAAALSLLKYQMKAASAAAGGGGWPGAARRIGMASA